MAHCWPPGKIIVDQDEYEANQLYQQWTLSDLRKAMLNKSRKWIINMLADYRSQLDVDNGGPVRYPTAQGSPYRIDAHKMSRWLSEHWSELDWDRGDN